MNKKFCHHCGKENDIENTFCPDCGTRLFDVANDDNIAYDLERGQPPAYNQCSQSPPPPVGYTQPPVGEYRQSEVDFDGVSGTELYAYTGSDRIMDKFTSMHLSNSKVSWCWPVAVLSFFFGFFGAAFWFLYRKMYKVAVILIAAGVIFQCAGYLVTGEVAEAEQFVAAGQNMTSGSEYLSSETESEEYVVDFTYNLYSTDDQTPAQMLWNALESALAIILTVLCGLFSLNIYKEHCIRKIKDYRVNNAGSTYYYYRLATVGGHIGTMILLAVLGYIVLESILTAVFAVIFGV